MHRLITILDLEVIILMINFFNFFNKYYEDLNDKNLNEDKDLVKYFKSEFGKEWKIELDKYLIKAEHDIDKKLA